MTHFMRAINLFSHAVSSLTLARIHRLVYTAALLPAVVSLSLLFLVGELGFTMEWPDESGRIQSTFGAAGRSHFQRGLAFKSEGQLISSWEAGEVIWADDVQSLIPSRGVVVVEHQNGFRSVYLGVERLHNLGVKLASGQWLGYARGAAWRFEIVDTEQSKLVNPVFILPARPEISPLDAGNLEMSIPDGTGSVLVQDEVVLSAGRQTIVISDVFPDGNGIVPAEISIYWIGQRIAGLRISTLSELKNEIVLETPKPLSYESVFSPNGQIWFPNIYLNEGRGELELRIKDEVGRVFIRRWSISIQ